MHKLKLSLFSLVISGGVYAAPLVTVEGVVHLTGSGCQPGTFETVLSPDKTTLSVLFSDFAASLTTGRRRRNSSECTIRLPLRVPAGYRIRVLTADYRGFAQLSAASVGSFKSRVRLKDRLAQRLSPGFKQSLKGPLSEELFLNPANPTKMKACGGKIELAFRQRLKVASKDKLGGDSVSVDSFDFTTDPALAEHLVLETCR